MITRKPRIRVLSTLFTAAVVFAASHMPALAGGKRIHVEYRSIDCGRPSYHLVGGSVWVVPPRYEFPRPTHVISVPAPVYYHPPPRVVCPPPIVYYPTRYPCYPFYHYPRGYSGYISFGFSR